MHFTRMKIIRKEIGSTAKVGCPQLQSYPATIIGYHLSLKSPAAGSMNHVKSNYDHLEESHNLKMVVTMLPVLTTGTQCHVSEEHMRFILDITESIVTRVKSFRCCHTHRSISQVQCPVYRHLLIQFKR